ncbi:MAG: hypothetical protein P8X98_15475 [Woeseiaceae bacterium]
MGLRRSLLLATALTDLPDATGSVFACVVSCDSVPATCHRPALQSTNGLQRSVAIATSRRITPSIVGAGYSPWLYRDGRL